MTRRVVTVGATGQIGRPLCRELMSAGHCVVVFSRDPSRARDLVPGAADYVAWSPDEQPASRLLAVNFAACLLLLIQYLLGMAVNLYVVLPAAHPGAAAPGYFTGAASGLAWLIHDGPAWAGVHAAFGLALVIAAFAGIALTRGRRSRMATVLSVLGALAILGAAFNGVSFLNYGHAFSSMIMAGLWALALACYLTGMFLAGRPAGGNPA